MRGRRCSTLNQRFQQEGEKVDTFITALFTLSEHCKYGALTEELIRDRIVVGIRDSNLSLKLQLDEKLDLDKAVTQAREAEMIKQQQPTLRGAPKQPSAAGVGMLRKKSGTQPRRPQQKQGSGSPKQPANASVCGRCGKAPPHDRQHCPAKDATCHACAKRGHYQSMCRSAKKVGEVHHEDESDDVFLGAVGTGNEDPWLVTIQLEGKPVVFYIDTGAEVSVITETVYEEIGNPPLSPAKQTLRAVAWRGRGLEGPVPPHYFC